MKELRWSRQDRRRDRDVYGRSGVLLPTGEEAAAHDRAAGAAGAKQEVLMENAARAAAAIVHALQPHGRIVCVAGRGNNGGDAIVLARVLHTWDRTVTLAMVHDDAPPPHLLHGHTLEITRDPGCLAQADVIVDGILGTGAHGVPRSEAAHWLEAMNTSGRPIIALDLPSGINATTGEVPGAAAHATVTVTFGWPKLGMMLHPARAHCGRIIAVEIGFPPWPEDGAFAEAITPGWARAHLPARAATAHKTSSGRLLILAGSRGMGGAAALAGGGAQRAGAGLIRIASDACNRVVVQNTVPEALFLDRAEFTAADAETMHAVVAGPGLGTDEDARNALERVLSATAALPLLLDADALNLHARAGDALRALAAARPLLLTPHPGELARLLDADKRDVTSAPVAAARRAAEEFGCAVLLKGQPSIVAAPGERTLVNTTGSSDLASAGMGDQLAGVAGAFLAARVPPRTAAALALYFGGRAADLAHRGRSLSPRDVTDYMHAAFERRGAESPSLPFPFITFDQAARG